MNKQVACATCGKTHPVSDSELTFGLPDEIFALPEEEREARCKVGSDIVLFDADRFFIRGLLPLNVAGRDVPYRLGVWAEVSGPVYERICDLWSDEHQDREPRMPGRLANHVPFHPDTTNLGLSIQLTGPKTRPEFYLEPSENSLYTEQTRGIDEHRALEYSDPEARAREY
jgi:hypothetical protein